jgi:hypothetical protein
MPRTRPGTRHVHVVGTRAHLTLRDPRALPYTYDSCRENNCWLDSGLGFWFVFWVGPPGPAQTAKQKPKHFAYFLVLGTRAHLRDPRALPIPMILAVKRYFLEIRRPRARARERPTRKSKGRSKGKGKGNA